MRSFEAACLDTERAADAALKAASALSSAARQLLRAAQDGDVGKIRRLRDRLGAAHDAARQEIANARDSWPFSPEDEEEYLRDAYEQELLDEAGRAGLKLFRADDRLVAFPSLIRLLPADRAVRVDRKRVTTLRPKVLIGALKANQNRKPRFTPDRFIETLFRAYRLVLGTDRMGVTARLADVYDALTLLPGAATEYGKSDFTRDLFLLDRSGVSTTKSGLRMSLPASTGTKGGRDVLQFVAPDGETVTYYGLRFAGGA